MMHAWSKRQGQRRAAIRRLAFAVFGSAIFAVSGSATWAGTREGLAAAFVACTEFGLAPAVRQRYLTDYGWERIADASTLDAATRVIADGLSIPGPLGPQVTQDQFDPTYRSRTHTNVRRNITQATDLRFYSETWALSGAAGDSYLSLRTNNLNTKLTCAAGTKDQTGGRAFVELVWSNAPMPTTESPIAERRASLANSEPPLTNARVTVTDFNIAGVEARLSPPFEAETSFFIVTTPRR